MPDGAASFGHADLIQQSTATDAALLTACQEYIDWITDGRARDATTSVAEANAVARLAAIQRSQGIEQHGDRLVREIAALPARTHAGRAAKVRALRFYYGGNDDAEPFGWRGTDALLASTFRDLVAAGAVA